MEESAPQIVTSNLENRKLRPDRLNLDKIGAIKATFFSILAISIFPFVIRLGATLIELLYPLRPGGMFLIFFAGAFAYAWQLASSTSLVVKYLRGERGGPSQHISFGFNALPKVLLSHSILILSLFFLFPASTEGNDFSSFIRSMLLVIVSVGFFLSWAPAFVAGEYFTKPLPPMDEDPEDFDSIKISFLKPKFFSGMGILDLGIERSFYFCVNNFLLTVLLLFLGLCVKVIPAALGIIIFGNSSSYGAAVVESLLSSIGVGMLMVALGLAFLGALPKDARAELELLDDSVIATPPSEINNRSVISKLIITLTAAASVFAVYFLIRTIKVEQSFPTVLIPQTFEVKRAPNSINIKFELDDSKTAYRWLDADRFRLQVPKSAEEVASLAEQKESSQNIPEANSMAPKKGGVVEALQNKLSKEEQSAKVQGPQPELAPGLEDKFHLLPPKEALFYSENDQLLDEKFFKPYYGGKIRVSLTFETPPSSENKFNLESSIDLKSDEQKLIYLLIDQTVQELKTFSVDQPSTNQK